MLIILSGFAFANLGLEQERVFDRNLFAGGQARRDLHSQIVPTCQS
jgi:hypothetical protein